MQKEKRRIVLILAAGLIVVLASVILFCFTCFFQNHEWVSATCVNPDSCSKCGTERGEALGHVWQDANFQAPSVCLRCGENTGEPRTPGFVESELAARCDAAPDEIYSFATVCRDNASLSVKGAVSFSGERVYEGDEAHEPMEGYVWHDLIVTISFDGENVWYYGASYQIFEEDFYDPALHLSSVYDLGDNAIRFTADYYGKQYTECIKKTEYIAGAWKEKMYTTQYLLSFRLPEGYDGIVVGVRSAAEAREEGKPALGSAEHLYRIGITR